MAETSRSGRELDAFFHFFATFTLTRPVTNVVDLSDGAPLFEILSIVYVHIIHPIVYLTPCSDDEYFRQSPRPSTEPSDNWIICFGALKRLYRLMTQYFSDVLQKPTSGLDVPNLSAMAKDHDITPILIMCRMTIAIGVQCEKNKEFIEKIQGLNEADQHTIMKAIEQVRAYVQVRVGMHLTHGQVMARINSSTNDTGETSMTEYVPSLIHCHSLNPM